jgi:hypothetical protein
MARLNLSDACEALVKRAEAELARDGYRRVDVARMGDSVFFARYFSAKGAFPVLLEIIDGEAPEVTRYIKANPPPPPPPA